MTKVNNFYVPKVDSLRVRVPICDIEIIDRTLIDNLITVLENTGEVIEQKKGKPFKKETPSGLAFKIWARERKDISESEIKHELYFLVNAKHLKERYFEGITIDNVDLIRQEINSLNVIKIDADTFLNCDILDVDMCFDFEANPGDFKKYVVNRYSDMAFTTKRDRVYSFTSKSNLGLELNNRDYSTPGKPHAKFYHKGIELENNSASFADKFLKNVDYANICRFEFNLKNRRYFKHYGIGRIKTLKQLLKLSTKRRLFQDVYQNWFVQRQIKPATGLDFKDMLLHSFFELTNSLEIDMVMSRALSKTTNRNQPSKIRSYYHNIMTADKKEFHEANRILLTEKLDAFFGVQENRTYDVRTNVTAAVSKKIKDINDEIPF